MTGYHRMESLRGKTALVTGASKRIGREISLELARAGINVVVHYNHSQAAASELCDELINLGVKSWPLQASFDLRPEYETLIDRAFDIGGQLDFLINNASIFPEDNLETLDFESLMNNIQINAWAPFILSKNFNERVTEGKIINLLDSRTDSFDLSHVGYILSKHVLTALTKMMTLQYAPKITVNAIAPGLILPPPGKPQSYLEERVNTVPLKRHGGPEDIAQAVIYLLKTNFITGNVIYIDGGRHLKEYVDGQNTH